MTKHKLCNKNMTFSDCELTVLRNAVDKSDKIMQKKNLQDPEIRRMLNVIEIFLKKKKINMLWRNSY